MKRPCTYFPREINRCKPYFSKCPHCCNTGRPQVYHGYCDQVRALRREAFTKDRLILQLTGDIHKMTKEHAQEVAQLRKDTNGAGGALEGILNDVLQSVDENTLEGPCASTKETTDKETVQALEEIFQGCTVFL